MEEVLRAASLSNMEGDNFSPYAEWCLKTLVIRYSLDKEMVSFTSKPSLESMGSNLLLSFLQKLLVSFPLFKHQENAHDRLDRVITAYPKLKALALKATKKQKEEQKYPLAVNIFDVCIKTSLELRAYEQGVEASAVLLERRMVYEALNDLMLEVESTGPKGMVEVLKGSPTIESLPPKYRNLIDAIHSRVVPGFFEDFSNPKQLNKCQRIYQLMPVKALVAISGMANPVKMMQSLMSLVFARPFNSRSLLQRIFEEISDVSKTDKAIAALRRDISDSDFTKKVTSHIDSHYDPMPFDASLHEKKVIAMSGIENPKEFVVRMMVDQTTLPRIDINKVVLLNDETVKNLHALALLEMRRKDKMDFVELLGSKEFTETAKGVLPLLFEPLSKIYSKADIPAITSVFFETTRVCLDTMKGSETKDQKMAKISTAFRGFELAIMTGFCKVMDSNQGSEFEELVQWMAYLFNNSQAVVVDLKGMVDSQSPEDKQHILEELKLYVEYKDKKHQQHLAYISDKKEDADAPLPEKIESPVHTFIPKLLVDPFVQRVHKSLSEFKVPA